MSQERLADVIELGDRATLSRWENDRVEPELNYIPRLCAALGVTADWLLLDRGDPEPRDPSEAEMILQRAKDLAAELYRILRVEPAGSVETGPDVAAGLPRIPGAQEQDLG